MRYSTEEYHRRVGMAVDNRWSHRSIRRLRRYVLIVVAAHAGVLVSTYFLFALGDTLFVGYASLVRQAALPRDPAQVSWLQRMASDVAGAVGWVVVLSMVLQMLLYGRSMLVGPQAAPSARSRPWLADLAFSTARALRAVGTGLAMVASVSVLGSELRANADVRAYATVAAAVAGVGIADWFTRLPGGSGRRGRKSPSGESDPRRTARPARP